MANVLILSGYGLNCEEETQHAFDVAGAAATTVMHVNDLLNQPSVLDTIDIFAIPGGFSFGDDTGSGNALAERMRHKLGEKLQQFVQNGGLVLGICNGCQVLVNLGLVPRLTQREVAMLPNQSGAYECRWVHVNTQNSQSPWLTGVEAMHIPVAHGEGHFYMEEAVYTRLLENGQVAATYTTPQGAVAEGEFPHNPNGSMHDIAALTDETGHVLAMMPHPERALYFTQTPNWTREKEHLKRQGQPVPTYGDGLKLFENAVAFVTGQSRSAPARRPA